MREQMTEKHNPYCVFILITTPKLAKKAVSLLQKNNVPVQYECNAVGTASSEMIDVLGLGTPDKNVCFSLLPKQLADEMMKKLKKVLKLGTINSGIAFTLILSGASRLVVRMLEQLEPDDRRAELSSNAGEAEQGKASRSTGDTEQCEWKQSEGEERAGMSGTKYSLIAAVINQGYSENVMEAARTAGAGGGTVVPSRCIGENRATGFLGLSLQDEKDMVFIVAEEENKLKIMQAIGDKCGMHSEAKGIVVSLPIDQVIGLENAE